MKENNEDNYIDKVYVDLEDLIEGEIYLMEHSSNPENSILGIYKGRNKVHYNLENIVLQIISSCSSIPNHRASKLVGENITITGLDYCRFVKL